MGDYTQLKEKLCKELSHYGNRELTMSTLDTIDKLAHTIKNISKIEESEGSYEGGSNRSYEGGSNRSYDGAYDGAYDGDYDGASYRRRNSRGRYARDGYSRRDVKDRLYEMMEQANDEKTKADLRKLISTMENQ